MALNKKCAIALGSELAFNWNDYWLATINSPVFMLSLNITP